ncbi:MAG: hypothetical protein GX241_02600 [Ruminococcaceae bacterium]|nr:hypothetical protein [Oscillospiraceae bacterium]
MKNYDEITIGLLERRDRYVIEQKQKRKRAEQIVALFCCLCLVVVLAFAVGNSGFLKKAPINSTENSGNKKSQISSEDSSVSDGKVSNKDTEGKDNTISTDIVDVSGLVTVDGVTYEQFFPEKDIYTPNTCLGDARDFPGTYQRNRYGYKSDVEAKLYTTKEDENVLIVKFEGGGIVFLANEASGKAEFSKID